MIKNPLYIDGDIYLHQASRAVERPICWDDSDGDELWSNHAFLNDAIDTLQDRLQEIEEICDGETAMFALSGKSNWRRGIYPEYKAHRKSSQRPLVFERLREWALENLPAVTVDSWEADDVLGVRQTDPSSPENAIIVTEDKDLNQIPGWLFNPTIDPDGPVEVSEEEADLFFWAQVLAGDPTDNLPGCPGIGMKTAQKILSNPVVLRPRDSTVTSGPNARWEKHPTTPENIWEVVVSYYAKEGLPEEYARIQAACVHILRYPTCTIDPIPPISAFLEKAMDRVNLSELQSSR